MLTYDGLQDVLTAVVVVVAVAVVVAAAWISTSVREQPLVATAVVVFHSGSAVESSAGSGSGSSSSVGDSSSSENLTEASVSGEAAATPVDKDSEAMEVREVKPDSLDRTQRQEGSGGETEAGGGVSEGPAVSPEGAENETRPSPPGRERDGPEMEVRRRRLQHFVSMGGATGSSESVSGEVNDRLTPPADTLTDTPADGQQCEEGVKEKQQGRDSEGREDSRPPGSIRIRLKFLDETQRQVFAQLTEKVGSFKRQHFSIELDDNRHIRLIFNGQLLSQDSSTLAHYGLFDNCVVHCHVSQPQLAPRSSGRSGEAAAQEEEDAYVSRLLAPLLYAVMVLMWYLRYEYGHLFNTMSTVILLFLTALLLISTYLLYITHHVPQANTATHTTVAGRTATHTPNAPTPSRSNS